MSLKNCNDTIGNRTRYLPVCSSKCFDHICNLSLYLHTLWFLVRIIKYVFCFHQSTHTCSLLGNTANEKIGPCITILVHYFPPHIFLNCLCSDTHTNTHTQTHTHKHTHTHTHTHTLTHTHTHTHSHKHTHTLSHTHTHSHKHVHTHKLTHTNTHTYTHTHTHIHTYTHTLTHKHESHEFKF